LANLILNDRTIRLHRYPHQPDDPLQPWDAADHYLLNQLPEIRSERDSGSPLVVGDAFGALAVALHANEPVSWNDSHLAEKALAHNLALNGLSAEGVTFVPGDRDPEGHFDLVLLKIPKSLAQLEDILLRLRPRLKPGSIVLAGSMIKHTPARVYRLLEKCIGSTTTSLGWKKARLATATFEAGRVMPDRMPESEYEVEGFGWKLVNGPNLFSRDGLDLGARLLLNNLPRTDEPLAAADLGCGNGILALALAAQCPAASVLGVDESYQAVSCARRNLERAGLADRAVRFEVGDGLAESDEGSLNTVICNPPFHQAQTVGDHLAWRMFEQAQGSLRQGGEIRIVGNRHLGYHLKLKRLFGNCEVLAADRKFVVLRARR